MLSPMTAGGSTLEPDQQLGRRWARERTDSVPNTITLARTIFSMVMAVRAFSTLSIRMLIAAYLLYWLGDILDGAGARRPDQETKPRAVFDIARASACTPPVP